MRVALVTGASRGIGAASARRLAKDGMAVAINSYPDGDMLAHAKEVAEDIRSSGGEAAVFAADITDADAVDEMFSDCEQQLGPVSALVLNAAATGRLPWDEISEAAWDKVSEVNLKGAFLCCRRAFGGAHGQDGGAIVTISSVQAKLGAPQSLHYTTTKAGILGFTRALARELGSRGIRVNAVMPGAIQTEEELESFPDQEDVSRRVLDNQMLQRRGLADDIAGTVSFLLSPDSGFMTGQTLCVDGGWVLL
ncbi:SDR family oxidoreductase [Amycolatopsis acidiphila]|uniref:SDR family oxidoreductase n=1 Tax=Amycolatopsis acidiphila TaxID=715473 RepID=A0A558AN85_9PSEU|nr:SDR family NAD(P)-dependent oxidoreductase [Amycolatopsis acidiphila]TVT25701.1 SDR family oxidoreductase [Amycolatopsis acidiphila]UIJ60460.1 SDR family oxidoreductase [Amycolatopsis acidiphila]GHG82778.1 beta-ketoacyl-ACP reductase [Amycolatopsis acidiphila]